MSILGWNFVRQRGFEPPRYCYRQPLKLVRLPVPPLPHVGYECILACNLLACNHGCSQTQPSLQLTVHSSKPESGAGLKAALQDCAMVFSAATVQAARLLEPVATAVAPRVAALPAIEKQAAYSTAAPPAS